MRSMRLAVGIVAAVAFVLAIGGSVQASPIYFGTITDPLGDASGGFPDIVSASVTIDSAGTALLSVTYAPGTSLTNAFASFCLDTDQNPATGWAGVDAGGTDSALIGPDFLVWIFGSSFQAAAEVRGGSTPGPFPVTYSGTTAEATIPLSALGDDDGLMNFKVVSAEQLDYDAFTGVRDYAPDAGLAPGFTATPEPATLSFLALGGLALLRRRRRKP